MSNTNVQDDKEKDKDKPKPIVDTTKPTPSSIAHKLTNTITTADSSPANTESEKISANARVVILGLFALVGFLVLLFAVTALRSSSPISDVMVQVFTSAITGAFTLGGVLITQLWGK